MSYELASCKTLGSTKPLAGAAEQIALQAQPIEAQELAKLRTSGHHTPNDTSEFIAVGMAPA